MSAQSVWRSVGVRTGTLPRGSSPSRLWSLCPATYRAHNTLPAGLSEPGSEDRQLHEGRFKGPSAGSAMEVRHTVGLDEENAGMGSRLQDWQEPLFSCSEGPRGRKQLVGAAGADYGSLCVNLNMRPQVWGGREPRLLHSREGPALTRGGTRDTHVGFWTASHPGITCQLGPAGARSPAPEIQTSPVWGAS